MTALATNGVEHPASGNGMMAPALPPQGKAAALQVIDNSQFANLLDTAKFEHIWRVASMFAKADLVPQQYRGKPENCFIACQMSVRLGVDPFMFMQNTYVVHGRPGMEAKLAIALINTSGLFVDGLDYDIYGNNPAAKDYRVRAFATRKGTNKRVEGPWIDWDLVVKEGWDKKEGSKWRTMPGMMFQYRSATFFGRLHCPERLMGMQTVDELDDVGVTSNTRFVENIAPIGGSGLKDALSDNSDNDGKSALKDSDDATGVDDETLKSPPAQAATPTPKPKEPKPKADKPAPTLADRIKSLNPLGAKCFADVQEACRKETGCDEAAGQAGAVAWLGSLGFEVDELITGKVREAVVNELPNADWARYT